MSNAHKKQLETSSFKDTSPHGEHIHEGEYEVYDLENVRHSVPKLKEIGKVYLEYLKEGMTPMDSMIMADINIDEIAHLKEKFVGFRHMAQKAELTYKHFLIKAANEKVKKGDTKMISKIMASKYPNEYGVRKPKEADESDNKLLTALLGEIQKKTAPSALIAAQQEEEKLTEKEPMKNPITGKVLEDLVAADEEEVEVENQPDNMVERATEELLKSESE